MPVGTEPPPAQNRERLRVGNWTVEPALKQLSAAGKTVKLEPKTMAVLAYLARRPGQVVSREELLSAVWAGVVVGDDSLTQVVIKLRKALGDAPEHPAYIRATGWSPRWSGRRRSPPHRLGRIRNTCTPSASDASRGWREPAWPHCCSLRPERGGSRASA